MKKEYKFKYQDKVFLFILENSSEDKMEANKYPYISCLLYRTDKPDQTWEWKGHLKPLPQKVEFSLDYSNKINIKGYMTLFISEEMDIKDFIFMNTQYGIHYEAHFEGNVFEIG